MIEALACGCPAGQSEILEDPDLLAPVGDQEAPEKVMLQALARPAEKTALRAIAARFSLQRAVDEYGKFVAALPVRDGERREG